MKVEKYVSPLCFLSFECGKKLQPPIPQAAKGSRDLQDNTGFFCGCRSQVSLTRYCMIIIIPSIPYRVRMRIHRDNFLLNNTTWVRGWRASY